MHVVVTISGNSATPLQNDNRTSAEASVNDSLIHPTLLTRENPHLVIPLVSNEQSNLEVPADAEMAKVSESLIQHNPPLAQHVSQHSANSAPVAADAVAGLASILSKLEAIVQIDDLLADVSNRSDLFVAFKF